MNFVLVQLMYNVTRPTAATEQTHLAIVITETCLTRNLS